jgi:FHA domain
VSERGGPDSAPVSDPGALAYTAGPNVALVAPGSALVFAQPPTGETVARCWPLVRDRAGVRAIVDALVATAPATAPSAVPGFAFVCVDANGVSVVLRGGARASTLHAGGRTQHLNADGLTTWLERRLDAGTAAVIVGVTEGELPPPVAALDGDPLVGGTVLAGSVTLTLMTAPDRFDLAEAPVAPVLESPPTPPQSPPGAFAQQPLPPQPLPPQPLPPQPLPPVPVSVTVQAVACPYGHLGPTYEPYCRICGTAIEDPRPFLAVRPPLGLVRLSTGDVVPLDRSVIMGRNPRTEDGNEVGRPHLVRLPSPDNDVSRTHVEVRLEDWHVLVVDLASTNGTTVTNPGQAPIRLRAHEPMPLEPNAEVNLADEIVFRYEVPTA